MRTIEQLKQEIALRKELDLPHIVLTLEEKKRAFGDCSYKDLDRDIRIKMIIERQSQGLKLSRDDLKQLRKCSKIKQT